MITAPVGCYLVACVDTQYIFGTSVAPSVSFVAETDGCGNWTTLCGRIVTGKITAIIKIEQNQ